MRKTVASAGLLVVGALVAGCSSSGGVESVPSPSGLATSSASTQLSADSAQAGDTGAHEQERATTSMKFSINGEVLDVAWEDNESVAALRERVAEKPLEVQLLPYGGFEQVGDLGGSLPRHDEQIAAQAGDIMLYQGSQIVVFYGSNSWAYTRLGHIDGKTAEQLAQVLGADSVTVRLELQ